MKDVYFYDGRFVRADEPVVRLTDRGYQFGDGVYDAWMVYGGKQFMRREHLDRLEQSCAAIGIVPCYSRAEVEAFTDMMLERSGLERAVFYLQWTRGWQMPRAHAADPVLRPVLSGYLRESRAYPDEYFSKGVRTILYPDVRQHFCDIKSLNLLGTVLASNAAKEAGCYEAILVREDGGRRFVTEGSHTNCYAVSKGRLHTAPLGKLILPGVMRGVVLKLARESGIEVIEEFGSPEFFRGADEVLISAASGILPVGTIDGEPVRSCPGPVFRALDEAYRKFLAASLAET